MRTRTGKMVIACDGCPELGCVGLDELPWLPGWGRVTFEQYTSPGGDPDRPVVLDLCPLCVAALPWRQS